MVERLDLHKALDGSFSVWQGRVKQARLELFAVEGEIPKKGQFFDNGKRRVQNP